MQNKIPGGYILIARKMLESEIMDKPPLYFKLWGWMLLQAKFKPQKGLARGQFKTSIKEMQDAMTYYVGYRKVAPTVKQIRYIYESLTNGSMIGTTKGTTGLIITILNYDKYQEPKNYEGHNEREHEGRDKGTPLYNKEREERKKETYSDDFEKFWSAYPLKISKLKAWQAWGKQNGNRPPVDTLLSAIQKQTQWRKTAGPKDFRPEWKHPATWLNQACWNDEVDVKPPEPAKEYVDWTKN